MYCVVEYPNAFVCAGRTVFRTEGRSATVGLGQATAPPRALPASAHSTVITNTCHMLLG